jgi:nitrite reductase/ring-hydroxylating ferredoxin subunit
MSAPLTSVAVYRRTVNASLERVHENVRDWEHLPWLHRASFASIERLAEGEWGWRARVGLQPEAAGQWIELELAFEPDLRRYVARTLAGSGAGSEIWTALEPSGERETRIAVEFRLADVRPEGADAVGAAFTRLYTRLWDEDEGMMVERTRQLDANRARRDGARELDLGPLDALRARLPLVVELGGRPFRLIESKGAILAHSTVCPHRLGPLGGGPLEDGCLRCPWHGYRFDLAAGTSADGRGLRLARAPAVRVDAASGHVVVRLPG